MSGARFYAVDDIEAGVVRLVDPEGRGFEIPLSWLPSDLRAGDVLELTTIAEQGRSLVNARRNDDERRRRLERSREVLARLKGSDPGGDLEL